MGNLGLFWVYIRGSMGNAWYISTTRLRHRLRRAVQAFASAHRTAYFAPRRSALPLPALLLPACCVLP